MQLETALRETAPTEGPIANMVERFLRRFVAMSDAQAAVLSIYVLHTHVVASAETTPYIAVTSAEMRSGKSRLLEALELLVARPLRAAGATEAALFRSLADVPTLLFDEIDAIFGPRARKDNEDLRALLNVGYRRGSPILRVVGDREKRVERFEVFGPKVLAGIGDALPDTVTDRSLPIRLKRRAPDERVERFRQRDVAQQASPIRSAIERWAEANLSAVEDARPEIPDELDDRAQDVVEPLLAIADLLGGEWPARTRLAVIEIKTVDDAEDSLGVRLLSDARSVLAGFDRIASAQLVEALRKDEEAPWFSYLESAAFRRLGRLLKAYGIASQTVRFEDGTTAKGYYRSQFQDAWARYLPENGPVAVTAVTTEDSCGFEGPSDPSQVASVTDSYPSQVSDVTDTQPGIPLNEADVTEVTGNRPFREGVGS